MSMEHPDHRPDHRLDHPREADSPAELAQRYIAGDLSPIELAAFETRLKSGDEDCRRALAKLRALEEALNNAVSAEVPPAHLLEMIESRLGSTDRSTERDAETDGRGEEHAGVPVILHAASRRWRQTGLRGIRFQTLFADRAANRRTVLLEAGPGAVFPDHQHASIEEVIVLEGDLSIGGTVLRKFDYIRVRPGVEHGEPWSKDGCIALIISGYSSFPTSSKISMAWYALTRALGFGRRGSG